MGCNDYCNGTWPGYICNETDTDGIKTKCYTTCGDKIKTLNDSCEDIDLNDDYGCEKDCSKPMTGYNCYLDSYVYAVDVRVNISVCFPKCGDGLIVKGEVCDDANAWDN